MAKEKVQIPGSHLQGLWGIKYLVAKYAAFFKAGPWKLEGGGVFLIDLLPFNCLRRGQGVPGRASRESRSLEPKGEGKGTKNRQGGEENFPLDVSGLKAHKDPPCNCFWCSVDMVLSQDRGDSRTEVWV